MTNVGLLFVGAVLFVNGASLLGAVSARDSAPFNLFVGAMQVIFPTLAILLGGGGLEAGYAIGPIYLFGFTYLYVGINNLMGNSGTGLGWFSLFVAVMAIWFGIVSLRTDPAFSVIWFVWAVMWSMFFAILALGRVSLTPFTGWLLLVGSHLTATIPAILIFEDAWPTTSGFAIVAGVIAVLLIAACVVLARVRPTLLGSTPTPPVEEGASKPAPAA
ncbi:transporter [Epidermidibacterium keratini]|uniref:Transporter n=1 Tax=Epidermidibacterium keratini TaxID=1891644 RepID=A0A7L4YSQ3_9ACTN|nr:AmiS/UreI family transporter [Epidermidibacterium keratini]QHC02130.1 transporter [Epidermidibacterium keratini]